MTDKLVDDLRAESQVSQRTAWERADGGQDYAISAQLADAAADRIEALTAERDQLRADLAAAEARLAPIVALIDAALEWWDWQRPLSRDRNWHILHPTVNVPASGQKLARCCADFAAAPDMAAAILAAGGRA